MRKQKILYIISKVDKAIAFEWIVDQIDAERFELSFLLLNEKADTALVQFLKARNIKHQILMLGGKASLPKIWWQSYRFIRKIRPDAVHTHLFEASLIGLSAAKAAGVKKRAYTRHHSTAHHRFHPKAVRYDHWINSLATHIVAISRNVQGVLHQMEQVPLSKIHLIHHGFDLAAFDAVGEERIKALREKYALADKSLVVGIISRYIEWKGHQYMIPAFKALLREFPKAHLVLANANGGYKKEVKALLRELPEGTYTEISFENDLFALYGLFDVFVHAPIDPQVEAFGQTYVETLAAGVPMVCTLSGIGADFIHHEENALVVPFEDSEAITAAVARMLKAEDLRRSLVKQGKLDVHQLFSLQGMIQKLESLYRLD